MPKYLIVRSDEEQAHSSVFCGLVAQGARPPPMVGMVPAAPSGVIPRKPGHRRRRASGGGRRRASRCKGKRFAFHVRASARIRERGETLPRRNHQSCSPRFVLLSLELPLSIFSMPLRKGRGEHEPGAASSSLSAFSRGGNPPSFPPGAATPGAATESSSLLQRCVSAPLRPPPRR